MQVILNNVQLKKLDNKLFIVFPMSISISYFFKIISIFIIEIHIRNKTLLDVHPTNGYNEIHEFQRY